MARFIKIFSDFAVSLPQIFGAPQRFAFTVGGNARRLLGVCSLTL
jgi:hypothetical protein